MLEPLFEPGWWVRTAVFASVFFVWAGPSVETAGYGLVAGGVAAQVVRRFCRPDTGRFRALAFVRFVPYFVGVALRGGVDVAGRAFLPSMPLEPGFAELSLKVDPGGAAAVFFASAISLIPGTLCVELEEDTGMVVVHAVDLDTNFRGELRRLERRSAEVFGESPRDKS